MKASLVLCVVALVWAGAAGRPADPSPGAPSPLPPEIQTMKKLTPVLLVEEIESALPFWIERLGFEQTMQVEEGDRLGFVGLARGGVEVMYQTRASVAEDVPALADTPGGGSLLFIEVDDLDAVVAALEGIEPVVPRRQTFYGADEISVREPGGHVVTFARFER